MNLHACTISYILTPLGTLEAIADNDYLYQLSFVDSPAQEKVSTSAKKTKVIELLELQLQEYFARQRDEFTIPLKLQGTSFQQNVWKSLQTINFGTTWSYQQLAQSINNPKACRAVAQANGANPFVIIVPCHRVINADGKLGGYSQGIERKVWLLEHEKLTNL